MAILCRRNPDADLTICEFMDYRCGYCKKAFSEVRKTCERRRQHPFIVKELPTWRAIHVASRLCLATKDVAGDEGL